MNADNISERMYGDDNGHSFKVRRVDGCSVNIEYLEDGREAWFQANRFESNGHELILR